MTPQQVQDELWRVAQDTAQQVNLEIGSDCANDLRNFIAGGVSRIQTEGRPLTEGAVLDAAQNLRLVLGAMIHHARQNNLPRLQEATLIQARLSLCPVWPFC